MIGFLFFLVFLNHETWAKKMITEPVQTKWGAIIHKYTANFIDIEAPAKNIWIGCSTEDPQQKGNSFFGVYVLDGDTAYDFFYRRVLDSVSICLQEKQEYQKLIRGSKTVRLVGILPGEEKGPEKNPSPHVPARFVTQPKRVAAVFIRLQAENKCKAYFSSHCDLPKNYWGGVLPNIPFEKNP